MRPALSVNLSPRHFAVDGFAKRVKQVILSHVDFDPSELTIEIAKYGSRHWAVFVDGRLLCVTVYKKGALAVRDALLHVGLKAGQARNSD